MFACAKQLATTNRLQKYKNFPTYTNFYEEKFIFCPFKAKNNLCITHFSVCTALRVQRYNIFLIYEDFFLFLISLRSNDCYLFQCDRLKTTVIACNICYRWMSILNELVDVERLTYEEEGGDKGVSDLQFGVN